MKKIIILTVLGLIMGCNSPTEPQNILVINSIEPMWPLFNGLVVHFGLTDIPSDGIVVDYTRPNGSGRSWRLNPKYSQIGDNSCVLDTWRIEGNHHVEMTAWQNGHEVGYDERDFIVTFGGK